MILVPLTADVAMHRLPWANWCLLISTVMLSIYVFYSDDHPLTEHEVNLMVDYYERTQPHDLKAINHYSQVELTRDDVKWTAVQVRNYVNGPHSHPLALHPAAFHSWQLVTHALVHTGWIILFVNMLFLFCFGNAVNAKLGPIVFLLTYFAIAALTGLMMVFAGRPVPVLGSSAAIMGVLGVFVVLFPRNDIRLYYWVWTGQRFNGICYLSAIWFILGFLLLDAIWFWRNIISGPMFLADVLCLVLGMLIAVVLVLTGWLSSEKGEENLLELMGWEIADR